MDLVFSRITCSIKIMETQQLELEWLDHLILKGISLMTVRKGRIGIKLV